MVVDKKCADISACEKSDSFENRLNSIQPLFSDVVFTEFAACPRIAKKWVGEEEARFRMRQIIVENTVKRKYLKKFYPHFLHRNYKKSSPVLGLPSAWRKNLVGKQGFKEGLFSKLTFSRDVCSMLISGCRQFLGLMLYSLENKKRSSCADWSDMENCHVACNFPLSSIAEIDEKVSLDCFSTWYCDKFLESDEKLVFSGVDLPENRYNYISMKYPFPRLIGMRNLLMFLFRSSFVIFSAFVGIICGRSGSAILSQDLIFISYLKSLPSSAFSSEYLFNNADWLHKPLWTFYVERKGCKVSLLYYSSNSLPIILNGVRDPWFGAEMMHWKHFFVWSDNQRNVISRLNPLNKASSFTKVPYVPFIKERNTPLDERKNFKIAVFDVKPVGNDALIEIGAYSRFYTDKNVIKFYEDIIRSVSELDVVLYLKPKRLGNGKTATLYYNYLMSLEGKDNVILLPNGTSARSVAEHCDATISMPFTSTSLIARYLRKPTAFYDPTGDLEQEGNQYDRIEHINSFEFLKEWVKTTVDDKCANCKVGTNSSQPS